MSTELDSADIMRILELLPHRYPFLMVDKIKQMRGDEFCIGIKNVTINEPQFQGHFPTKPIFPGVLLIEGMAQCAGAMCIASRPKTDIPSLVYFMTIDEAKFRKPVVPGDIIEYHMQKLKYRRNMWWFKGEAKVDGENAAEAIVSAMIVVPEK
ncbi:MAG: 3-hydroxyacyl-ACP dehydratase FabZ [Pseudomonadota bacterium]